MAYRTTAVAVKKIIETDDNISTDLEPFIEVANNVVTAHCTSGSLTAATLELVERWLSAHFYAIRDPRVESEKAGSVSQNLLGKVDLNLNQTRYGQQAMLIDGTGKLAAWNKGMETGTAGATFSFDYVGSEDTDT